jgi:hypothetical protein
MQPHGRQSSPALQLPGTNDGVPNACPPETLVRQSLRRGERILLTAAHRERGPCSHACRAALRDGPATSAPFTPRTSSRGIALATHRASGVAGADDCSSPIGVICDDGRGRALLSRERPRRPRSAPAVDGCSRPKSSSVVACRRRTRRQDCSCGAWEQKPEAGQCSSSASPRTQDWRERR